MLGMKKQDCLLATLVELQPVQLGRIIEANTALDYDFLNGLINA
jgi:hypothetical protein